MLKELKDEICKELMKNSITESMVIKDYFNQTVNCYFYKLIGNNNLNTPEDFIIECSRALAKKKVASNPLPFANEIIMESKVHVIYYELVRELDMIVPHWRNYKRIEDLINDIAEQLSKDYKPVVFSLDDAVLSTVNRNIELGYRAENTRDIERLIIKIFDDYFSGDTNVFTSKQGARKYVLKRSKRQILEEMNRLAKINTNLTIDELQKAIINAYAKNFSNSFCNVFYEEDYEGKRYHK